MSKIIYFSHRSKIGHLSRLVVDRLVSSKFGTSHGIHLTIEKPYGTNPNFNIYRDSVLRQYFGLDVSVGEDTPQRYRYGTGGEISSVGIHPANFMTRPCSSEMSLLAREIHEFLL